MKFVGDMLKEFEMSMIGEMKFFLGLKISQTGKGIFISQTKYVKELLKKFGLDDSKPVGTPMVTGCKLSKNDESPKANQSLYRSMVGGLLYLTQTRPHIMHVVCMAARYQVDLKESHVTVVKRIFRYLKGTLDYSLWYPRNDDFMLCAYTDVDWVGDVDDQKSTSSVHSFWVVWMKQMLKDIRVIYDEPTVIYCDNSSAINMSKNLVQHSKSKHVSIKYHFLTENVSEKEMKLEYVSTKEKIVDIFTKPLHADTFVYLRDKLGVSTPPDEN
ncbi:hypothetical protein SUGI_0016200 [Cryptomeria japonica]|nr:hypothetical protein SUGI_0016200 [Cryptomeria japonica]